VEWVHAVAMQHQAGVDAIPGVLRLKGGNLLESPGRDGFERLHEVTSGSARAAGRSATGADARC
jgi:hypothetical protein